MIEVPASTNQGRIRLLASRFAHPSRRPRGSSPRSVSRTRARRRPERSVRSESSTPQYRAAGSATTRRGSPRAVSAVRMSSGRSNCAGPTDLDDPVDRISDRGIGYRLGDVGRGHRRNERGRQTHRVTDRGGVRDGPDEFEELRRMHDRVGDRSRGDELLLGQLGPKVSALLGQSIGADHRERDVVADAGHCFGREQIGRRPDEELHRRGVLERRRVRHVDDYRGAVDRVGKALARQRVHAGPRRCRDGVVPAFGQLLHQLRPHQAGSADDDDSHGDPQS